MAGTDGTGTDADRIERAVLDCLGAVAPDADLATLVPDRPFRDQFEFDSVDFLNFVMKLEIALNVRVPELDYPQLTTLDGCRSYLAKALSRDAAQPGSPAR
ncbi:acyl carrier protein [Azospirillum rugosum]|uniref:Acyl carrier protein n=1 Tax=Azospirillum rugosum TaxID=416170 RepID=A0ABS4SWH8_9PROT|nr:acyl carrier protein [Azospirillum rugosum]MBP2296921.1 acyl carrier protein [Azospirillum rugosum]MDQ0530680.1 acyl carrier protein [Azospirillum rugosum]